LGVGVALHVGAVVGVERELHGVDAGLVARQVPDAVGGAHHWRGRLAQRLLELRHVRLEEVEVQAGGLRHRAPQLGVGERAEDDGRLVEPLELGDHLARPRQRADERPRHGLERDVVETRQQALPDHLRRDAGVVGHEVDVPPRPRAHLLFVHVSSSCTMSSLRRRIRWETRRPWLRTRPPRRRVVEYIVDFGSVGMGDVARVGGKNASIGEMIANLSSAGVRVPGGFATTADAYRDFLDQGGVGDKIRELLADVDGDDVAKLAERGKEVRELLLSAPLPERLSRELRDAYAKMCAEAGGEVSVAVRSSATAEDLPEASFAGQQETYLNVCGLEAVEDAVRKVFASLFTDRAISYRLHHGFAHEEVALSAGVQPRARRDLGSSGVAFTLDTESGFDGAVFVTAPYGLGELLVQGAVNPGEFYLAKKGLREGRPAVLARKLGTKAEKMVYAPGGGVERVPVAAADRARFSLDDDDLHELGRQCVAIEDHYGRPMDIEWVKDGEDGLIYIVQARPETVQSRSGRVLTRYRMKGGGEPLVVGRAVGSKVATGVVRVIARAAEMERVQPGDVLVTDMTDPDWEPVMKR